jgi:coenzyme F420-reducing hydrogenase beta subunit
MIRENNILDIVNQDLCTGCGACVSESKESLKIGWNEFGFLVPQQIGNNINKEAIKVCPFNPSPDDEVKDEDKLGNIFLSDAAKYDSKIGRFENTYIGFVNEYRETSSSGGVATFVFRKLLEDKIVENLFIVKEVNGTYEYQFFNNIQYSNL